MIRWFANNGIAANFLMLAILISGGYTAMNRIPLEVSPNLSWQTVSIEVPYRGGTAKDVERAILIPIEQALEGVEGIEHLNADGMRGRARFWIEAKPDIDVRALMDDIKARIDTITTFPDETERPRVYIPESGNFFEVLSVAVTGKMSRHDLREATRRVQEDLIALPGVSRANMRGDLRTEISIEAKADKLISYNLSFQDLADAIRRSSVDLPAGSIDSDSGTFVIRTRGQAYSERDFETIPIRAADGADVPAARGRCSDDRAGLVVRRVVECRRDRLRDRDGLGLGQQGRAERDAVARVGGVVHRDLRRDGERLRSPARDRAAAARR